MKQSRSFISFENLDADDIKLDEPKPSEQGSIKAALDLAYASPENGTQI
jgi:hypothetical protein